MRFRLSMILATVFLLAISGCARQTQNADRQAIQGTWQFVKMIHDKEEEPTTAGYPDLRFRGTQMISVSEGKELPSPVEFKLYPDRTPKVMEVIPDKKSWAAGEFNKCLYELDGNALHLCYAADGNHLPAQLKPAPDNVVYVLRRVTHATTKGTP